MQIKNIFMAISAATALLPTVYATEAATGPGAVVKAKCPYSYFMPKDGKWEKVSEGEADADSETRIVHAMVKFAADCKITNDSKWVVVRNGHVNSV
ncbi:hypothetical protein PpBr36_02661 [Pyricularia pennisetigena]|uniref:hypothetical protein n=1 Tax=Pyricularia pennisetigena TaxID=1578925 RepID=UPI0011524A42|nr:hypothetical protein PpBr36_02661 [Pyricularia pennisetigena]TLS30847.1 hypothetical protein PpBr36_02661 [Pyricularia pennisetigena]